MQCVNHTDLVAKLMAHQLPCQLVTGLYFMTGINLHLKKITLCMLDAGFTYASVLKN